MQARTRNRILTPEEIDKARQLLSQGVTWAQLEDYYELPVRALYDQIGPKYSHPETLETNPSYYGRKPQLISRSRTLTEEEISKIKELHARGLTYMQLEDYFNVPYVKIARLLRARRHES